MIAPAATITPLARLNPDTLRECRLAASLARNPAGLAPEEERELARLRREARARDDAQAEERGEGRLLKPSRVNPHE